MKSCLMFSVDRSQADIFYILVDESDGSCLGQRILDRICNQSDAPPFLTNS